MVDSTNSEELVVKNNTGTIYVSSISSKLIWYPKGHSSLVLVGMCRSGIWQQTHTNTNFSRKSDPFNMPIGPILRQILNKITRFFKRFLWLKFRKILKNRPIHIQNFAFYQGSFMYQEADFATHVGGTFPKTLLYWVPLGCNNWPDLHCRKCV